MVFRRVLVEAGDVHFLAEAAPRDRVRLGFAAIPEAKIAGGIGVLAQIIAAANDRVTPISCYTTIDAIDGKHRK
jgi:DNA-binding transcriptional MocR family regulator